MYKKKLIIILLLPFLSIAQDDKMYLKVIL